MESKVNARHLAFDMYNCKPQIDDDRLLHDELPALLEGAGFKVISALCHQIDDNQIATMLLLTEGHFALHFYRDLKYAAADFYICSPAAKPEKIFTAIRKFFRPDKTKTTYLKRGDFGKNPDMKPKVKTRYSPLRKIRTTGAKVIKLLGKKEQGNN